MRNKFLMSVLLVSGMASAQYPSGKTLLDKIDENMNAKSRIMTMKMEISTARGTRTMELKSWSEGADKAFTEYLAPAREKGTKMLKLSNQLWIYSPSTDRIIQISGHMLRQSMMGRDMSYEDMMTDRPLLEQYKAEVTEVEAIKGIPCYVLSLEAILPDVNYAKEKMWVDKEKFVPVQVDMFSKSGKLLKRVEFSDFKRVQDKWYPMVFVYKDMLKGGNGTRMIIEEIEMNARIPATLFNKSSLK